MSETTREGASDALIYRVIDYFMSDIPGRNDEASDIGDELIKHPLSSQQSAHIFSTLEANGRIRVAKRR